MVGLRVLWEEARVSWSSLSASSSSEENGGGALAGEDLGRKYLVMLFVGVGLLTWCLLEVPLVGGGGLMRFLERSVVGIVSLISSR